MMSATRALKRGHNLGNRKTHNNRKRTPGRPVHYVAKVKVKLARDEKENPVSKTLAQRIKEWKTSIWLILNKEIEDVKRLANIETIANFVPSEENPISPFVRSSIDILKDEFRTTLRLITQPKEYGTKLNFA